MYYIYHILLVRSKNVADKEVNFLGNLFEIIDLSKY